MTTPGRAAWPWRVRRGPFPVSAWTPALSLSATCRLLGGPCTRPWSPGCSTFPPRTRHKANCPTTIRRPRTSTLSRCTATTRFRVSIGCPMHTRSRPASRPAWLTCKAAPRPCAWGWCNATCCAASASRRGPTAAPTARRWSSVCPTRSCWARPVCCRAGRWTAPCSTALTSGARCARSWVRATRRARFARLPPPTAWPAACLSSWNWVGSGPSTGQPRAPASWPPAAAAAAAPGTRWAV